MALRDTPPFRADHVGSLLRPPELLEARQRFADGAIDADELREIEDAAIRDVVALQRDVGLRSVTDGEFRRASWHMDFIYQLDGISKVVDETLHVQFRNEQGTLEFAPPSLHVDDRIGLSTTIFGDAFEYLRSVAAGDQTPKLTIPSPSMVHYRGGRAAIDESRLPRPGRVLVGSHRRLQRRRCGGSARRVAATCSSTTRASPTSTTRRSASTCARSAATQSTSTRPTSATSTRRSRTARTGMAVTTHMCRGNYRSSWVAEGGYDFVAEALFSELEVDGFFMEWDDARSGGFEPLRFVPPGKLVVLGLVTTKRGELEDADTLKRRIEEASRYVDLDQLCLSPQCGFSSTVEGNALTAEQQAAKLRRVVEVAEEVWG